jgi:hypothetical protein
LTFVLVVTLHAGMEAIENYWINGRLSFGLEWGCLLSVAIAVYVLLASLKKRTGLLIVEGR